MGCDLVKYRRRRLFEHDQSALASEKAGKGFANLGHPARQWWIDWSDTDFPLLFTWLASARLLTEDPTNPTFDLYCEKNYGGDDRSVSLYSLGYNQLQYDQAGQPLTVNFTLICRYIVTSGGITNEYKYVSARPRVVPRPTEGIDFTTWAYFVDGVLIGGTLPDCTVWPLDRCHDCADDP